jgi:hypothetical protein
MESWARLGFPLKIALEIDSLKIQKYLQMGSLAFLIKQH